MWESLTYRLPPALAEVARPGARVRVPLGRRSVIGFIDRVGGQTVLPDVRPVAEVLDRLPLFSNELLSLCRWVSDYYAAPLGLVLRAALPPGLASADSATSPPVREQQVIRLTVELPTLTEREDVFGRAVRQREAFEVLESMGGRSAVAHLTGQLGFSRSVAQGLVERGVAEIQMERERRDPFVSLPLEVESVERPRPTEDQAAVISGLLAQSSLEQPGVALLRGVTGSGKTLVYLELLEELVGRQGLSAIVLVPEIALTPQTLSRFRDRFGERVAVLHSGLSAGERFDEWRALKEGEKRIAIGARSAVFAPLSDVGVIILDEEHESSYKQSDTPRYHARSVATMRARIGGCLCLLGSATPALESWANAKTGKYRLYELPKRVTGHPLPSVELIDLRGAHEAGGGDGRVSGNGRPAGGPGDSLPPDMASAPPAPGPVIFSSHLGAAIDRRLQRGEQVILLLNRRGYATFVQCLECGNVWSCRSCNVSLTYHRGRRRLVCHHCAYETSPPTRCDECGASDPSFTGLGTEQVERRLGELFPAARVARMDLDTTGTKWAHFEILEAVRTGQVDILLGTQMIAKGLDFPAVTLVGVVNADVSLNLPDFRASERTFQLLAQVAGRAGRGPEPGEVFVQTARPTHFALRAAAGHDYLGFATQELADRAEPGYPPHLRLANVVVSGPDERQVAEAIERVSAAAHAFFQGRRLLDVSLLGPAPCPLDRLRGRWRWHFLLKADRASSLGTVLRHLAERHALTGKLRLELDRDPESLL
jgi:primosomal protein N' (replication factor Y)